MPTYSYECGSCCAVYERRRTMSEHTATIECGCGGIATQLINWQGDTLVRGNRPDFKLDATCAPVGWEHGNTDADRQERRYARMIRETRKRARQNDKAAIKGGIRHIAKVPRELHRMRSNQFGKDYFDPCDQSTGEIKAKLKADGLLFKD